MKGWTPAFAGVTSCYECIKIAWGEIQSGLNIDIFPGCLGLLELAVLPVFCLGRAYSLRSALFFCLRGSQVVLGFLR
jgi:hypothetical protein